MNVLLIQSHARGKYVMFWNKNPCDVYTQQRSCKLYNLICKHELVYSDTDVEDLIIALIIGNASSCEYIKIFIKLL